MHATCMPMGGTLSTWAYSLHTNHYTLLTTHYSLHTTHYSLHTTHYTLLTTQYSLLRYVVDLYCIETHAWTSVEVDDCIPAKCAAK